MNIHAPFASAPSRPLVAGGTAGALILGGSHGSLAAARSLGRHGVPVWLLSDDLSIARFSRHVERNVRWPGPDHPHALEFLLALGRKHRLQGWVLFAASDADARFLAQHHDALAGAFRLTVPAWSTLKWADDKHLMNERAVAAGVAIPWSATALHDQSLAEVEDRFPLVLKPAVHAGRNAFTQSKAWRVDDRAQLVRRYRQAAALVGEHGVLLQELIPGAGAAQFSYAAVWDRGRPVASLVARRTRQYPIDFGYTSTCVETISRGEVEDAAVRFLRAIDYHGLVEIEFKYDARDASYKILDVNPRIWTWIGLGAAAGVDFPWLMWRVATDDIVLPPRAHTDAAWMHTSRDIVAALQEMRAGNLSLPDYVTLLRKRLTFAAGAWDDVVPGLLDLPLVAWRIMMRRLTAALRRKTKD